MAENSKIEWTDHTFNPWVGCTKISPACDHCYAEAQVTRFGGNFAVPRRTSAANWSQPLRWNAKAMKEGKRSRVFCASLADVFDNQVPAEWRTDLWGRIRDTTHLDWLLLTKRPQNITQMLPPDWGAGWPNVWLGVTAENQTEADRRIPILLSIPAAVRFLSCEPLLGPVDLTALIYHPCPNSLDGLSMDPSTGQYECCSRCDHTGIGNELAIDWVIVGGESGRDVRPMHPDWARSLRDQCVAAGVAFHFKQWGEWREAQLGDEFNTGRGEMNRPPAFIVSPVDGTVHCFLPKETSDRCRVMLRVGKKAAGRLLDGQAWDQFPKAGAA